MIKISTKNWVLDDIETVLFDKDGTFIDLHYFWGKMTELRVLEIIKRFKLDEKLFEQLCLFLGYSVNTEKMLSDGITALYSRVKIIEIFSEKLKEIGIFITPENLEQIFDEVSEEFYKELEKYTKPIPEAIDFIKDLRSQNVKIGIVTSDSIKSTKLTLKHFGWEYLFDVIIGRESSEFTKESGEPTKMALQSLMSGAATTLMIGDAPMDCISAKNAGIECTILVSTGQIGEQELQKHSPYVVKSLKELTICKEL